MIRHSNMCPQCGRKKIEKEFTYDELWFNYRPGDDIVYINCPEHVFEFVCEEPVNPDRYEITRGKYKGRRLSDIHDQKWLDFMYEQEMTGYKGRLKHEPLFARCIKLCQ